MKNFTLRSKRSGFTMLELVMVIIVMGIIASVAMPQMDRDTKQEGADIVLSDIRLTQHMALMDYRHSFNNSRWQRSFWKFSVESCASDTGLFIGIGSDKDYEGDTDEIEAALDSANGKPMFWSNQRECTNGGDNTVSSEIFITKKYGIKAIEGRGGCDGIQHIGFDHLGRPHVSFSNSKSPDYSTLMDKICTFKFTLKNNDIFEISILPESGHAFIVGQEDS